MDDCPQLDAKSFGVCPWLEWKVNTCYFADSNYILFVEHSLHARHYLFTMSLVFPPYFRIEVLLLVIVVLQKRIMLFRDVILPRAT